MESPCIQNSGNTAVGSKNGGMGYQGITSSMCLAFDVNKKIGVKTGGGAPSTSDATSPVDVTTLDLIHCTLAYSGTTLTVTSPMR